MLLYSLREKFRNNESVDHESLLSCPIIQEIVHNRRLFTIYVLQGRWHTELLELNAGLLQIVYASTCNIGYCNVAGLIEVIVDWITVGKDHGICVHCKKLWLAWKPNNQLLNNA